MSSPAVIEAVTANPAIRPTRVEIDLGAVRDNADLIARICGVDLYAVVKADAYGHGAIPVARTLAGVPGVAGFAVSLVEEGTQLRAAGIDAPILVMGPALAGGEEEIHACRLTAMIGDLGDLERLSQLGRRQGAPIPVHIKVDTGMGRLGMLADQLERLPHYDGVIVEGIATHFACAETDDPDDPDCATNQQLARLDAALARLAALGIRPQLVHAANSAGALRFPAARRDRVRAGIAVYGNGTPAPDGQLRQAMRFVTEIVQLRTLPEGASVGYGALWTARRPTRAAILPVGYADGFPRRLTGSAGALVGGRRFPVIGAISMDITVVDVTDLRDAVRVGDEVVLLGTQAGAAIPTGELAEQAGVSPYEVTCGVSKRVPRVYG